MQEQQPKEMKPAVRVLVTPERIGRHKDVEPFMISLPQHYRNTADMLAERILKAARPYIMSDTMSVGVDLRKGTFSIEYGRYGSGKIEEVSDGE